MSFNNKKTEYLEYMFNNIASFRKKLELSLQHASIYNDNDITQQYSKRESESLNRLANKCIYNDLICKRVETQLSPIDCIINNYNIQHKTSNAHKKGGKSFVVGLQKCAGKINGKRTFQPYSDTDGLDFFIIELIRHVNNFYIIPINKMIERELIKTKTQKGKQRIYIPDPDKAKTHWTTPYLNTFHLLNPTKQANTTL